MGSTTQERIKALEVALNNECQERAFYLKHAGRTKNTFGKAMFEAIANDEVEHYERIKELHKALSEKGKWPETVPLTVKGTIVKALLGKLVKAVDTSAKADMNDLEAVQIAIDFEAKGERFYADLRDSSSSPMEKDFFALIAAMEREHRLSLEDTRGANEHRSNCRIGVFAEGPAPQSTVVAVDSLSGALRQSRSGRDQSALRASGLPAAA